MPFEAFAPVVVVGVCWYLVDRLDWIPFPWRAATQGGGAICTPPCWLCTDNH
jgi:hypothetical protein